jgi:hydrogenase expression/formation protein HypE
VADPTPHPVPGAVTSPEPDLTAWTCPAPLRDSPTVVLGHGGGGALSAELVEHLFVPELAPAGGGSEPPVLAALGDCALVELGGARLAFSTDSYVVRPMFFPGGSIGDLAVNGTVNDLAMGGARPAYLSCGFLLEEGTALDVIGRVARALGEAARQAGVVVATGDTKVVEAGHGDGVYVNTAGIGLIPDGVEIRPDRARPGDVVLVSGAIGVHGVAVLSVREGLEFGTRIRSDTAPLNGLVEALLGVGTRADGEPGPAVDVHTLRDPTRGGLSATLNEIARAAGVGIRIDEPAVPVPAEVANACGLLGLDPWGVANEGKLVAFVPRDQADAALAALRGHPLGAGAAVIGECVAEHPGAVVARTALGGTRVVDLPLGEQLPRIC